MAVKTWSRRAFLGSAAAAGGGALLATRMSRAGGPLPNILYLYCDQLRGDHLGVAGHPVVQTPQIDLLAETSFRFARCYTTAAVCRGARATWMTGRYPHEHGTMTGHDVADPDGPSHVRRLRDEAGYLTAVIGKTHLHEGEGHFDDHLGVLERWGYSEAVELPGAIEVDTIESAYSDWLTATTPAGETDKYVRLQDYLSEYEARYWRDDEWEAPPIDQAPWNLQTADHLDAYTAQRAREWLRDYSDPRPFYLQVNFNAPHPPFDATRAFRTLYDPTDPGIPLGVFQPPGEPVSTLVASAQARATVPANEVEQRRLAAAYYAKVSMVDSFIGTVIDKLRATGLARNTWVILGSDHGEMLGEHFIVGKSVFFEPSIHVPLIIRPPGGTPPQATSGMVDQLDATRTVLDIAGLAPDGEHGRSLLPDMTAGVLTGKDQVVVQHFGAAMIRTDTHKLVVDIDSRVPTELYDLVLDPDELINEVKSAAYESERAALLDDLSAVLDA